MEELSDMYAYHLRDLFFNVPYDTIYSAHTLSTHVDIIFRVLKSQQMSFSCVNPNCRAHASYTFFFTNICFQKLDLECTKEREHGKYEYQKFDKHFYELNQHQRCGCHENYYNLLTRTSK